MFDKKFQFSKSDTLFFSEKETPKNKPSKNEFACRFAFADPAASEFCSEEQLTDVKDQTAQ